MRPVPKHKKRERGTSLVEVLVALLLLAVLMISILQMFSMVFVTNMGALARTELMYRCEETMENIRYINHLAQITDPAPVFIPNTGFPALPISANAFPLTLKIPDDAGNLAGMEYWTDVAEVIEGVPRYQILIEIVDSGNPVSLDVTLTARQSVVPGAPRYVAAGSKKVVQYVSQIRR